MYLLNYLKYYNTTYGARPSASNHFAKERNEHARTSTMSDEDR